MPYKTLLCASGHVFAQWRRLSAEAAGVGQSSSEVRTSEGETTGPSPARALISTEMSRVKKQTGDKDKHKQREKETERGGKKQGCQRMKTTTVSHRQRTKSSSSQSVLSPTEELFFSPLEVAQLCDRAVHYVNWSQNKIQFKGAM